MRNLIILFSIVLTACGGGPGGGDGTNNVVTNNNPVICAMPPLSVVPDSYKGTHPIPTPTQTLKPSIIRSIGMKDYNPSSNCNGYTNEAYVATLDKLKADGVDRVWIYNYGPWDNFANPTWTVDSNDWQISKTQMKFIVDEARKRNIDVFLAWQFSSNDKTGDRLSMGDPVDQIMLQRMLDSYHNLIVGVASYSQSIGIKGISLDWNAFFIPNKATYQTVWDSNMISIANDIRNVFSGKLVYGLSGTPNSPNDVYALVDEVELSLMFTLSQSDFDNVSISMLRDRFISDMQYLASTLPNNTPIDWQVAIQSKADYFVTGWTEDGFCVDNCIQNTYSTDFSMQAWGVEAALEAVSSQTQFNTISMNFGTSYWHTDTLLPGAEGFPNLSQSIRDKPAETIVSKWYKR